MPGALPKALVPALVLIITACLYLPTLDYGFVFDDRGQILESSFALTWDWAPKYFTGHLWSFNASAIPVYYRPGFMLWLLVNYQLFGPEPAWWHLTSIAAHLLCTLMVYFLARCWLDPLASGIAALLFGVHPVHVESVAWISAVNEPLVGICILASILSYIRWRKTSRAVWPAASAAMFGFALLEKETAIVLPAIIFIVDGMFTRSKKIVPVLGIYAALAVAYLIVRYRVLGTLMMVMKPLSLTVVVATWPSMLVFYLKQLLWPVGMSEFYDFPVVTHMSLRQLLVPAVLLGVAAYLLWRWSKADRAAGFATALLVIPLLPVLDFRAFGQSEVVHDRYLYLPSIGLCLLAGIAWTRLIPRVSVYHLLPLAAVVGFLGYRTVRESAFWQDDISLFRRAYEVSPNHPLASENLATALLMQGKPADALPYFDRALSLGSLSPEAVYGMGRVYFSMQDWDRAAVCFQQANLRVSGRISRYLLYEGLSDFRRGRLEDAESEIRQAIRSRTATALDVGLYHLSLAEVLETKGDRSGALAEYQAELKDNPASESARQGVLRMSR